MDAFVVFGHILRALEILAVVLLVYAIVRWAKESK